MKHDGRSRLTVSLHGDLDIVLTEVDFHGFRHPVCFVANVEIQVRLKIKNKITYKLDTLRSIHTWDLLGVNIYVHFSVHTIAKNVYTTHDQSMQNVTK